MAFDGLRVIAFESRRAAEIAELIRRQGGEPFVAPSMREVPIKDNPEVFEFAERLFRGEFDMMILLTGVGTRALNAALASRYAPTKFAQALRSMTVVARGPKPMAVLRELQVPVAVAVPEPNTWRELLAATEDRPERRIAVQEYGRSNPELLDGLRARDAEVTSVRVYKWALPEDTEPLREAVRRLSANEADVALFTTSIQVAHVIETGGDAVRDALNRVAIISIGPSTTEALEEYGIHPDLEPSHPKMGFLVKESAEHAASILARKRIAHV